MAAILSRPQCVKDLAITRTSADLLEFGRLGTGFDEVLTGTQIILLWNDISKSRLQNGVLLSFHCNIFGV